MFSHEQRLEFGRRICARILETFKESVLAVFITGSTAKALDRPFSDLEMTAIVKGSQDLPTKFYVYDGLLIQIDYRQESEFLKSAREPGRDWPLGADECRNRIVLFERDGWTRMLDEAVKENDAADFLAAVRNADFKDDMLDLRTRAFYMAWDTARVVYLLNRKYVLTTSWYWKQLFECSEQPRELRRLVETVAGFVDSSRQELVEAAERLWKETMLVVIRRGVSIESSDILV